MSEVASTNKTNPTGYNTGVIGEIGGGEVASGAGGLAELAGVQNGLNNAYIGYKLSTIGTQTVANGARDLRAPG